MDKELKARLLGFILVITGFIFVSIYPYLMYFVSESVSEKLVKATLTIAMITLGLFLVSMGVVLSRRD